MTETHPTPTNGGGERQEAATDDKDRSEINALVEFFRTIYECQQEDKAALARGTGGEG